MFDCYLHRPDEKFNQGSTTVEKNVLCTLVSKYDLAGASENENDFQSGILDELVDKTAMKIVCLKMSL